MPARRAEPVALRDGLPARRAAPQRGTAISAEPVAIPPGRAATQTRHHQTFIPRPGPPGQVTALERRSAGRPDTRSEPGDPHMTVNAAGVLFQSSGIGGRGIAAGVQIAPGDAGLPGKWSSGSGSPVPGYPRRIGTRQSGASTSPPETPQFGDTVPDWDPHRNPTDETAHSGTLVMHVKARRTAGQQRLCA
jgi:hypothetical protein